MATAQDRNASSGAAPAKTAAAAPAAPADSPERRRVAARLKTQLRIVKNYADREIHFLLCVGRESSAAWLHASRVTDAQKPLLTKLMAGDTGLKWYRGTCVWEEGAYTFVGPRLTKAMERLIRKGVIDCLHDGSVRIRARAPGAPAKKAAPTST